MSTVIERLPNDWAKRILDMYEIGCSDTEIRAELQMTKSFWDSLMDDLTVEFREIVEFGRMLSKAWWERQGRTNLANRAFNSNLYLMNMKNRFGWSEKTVVSSGPDLGGMDNEQLAEYIEQAVEKHRKTYKP